MKSAIEAVLDGDHDADLSAARDELDGLRALARKAIGYAGETVSTAELNELIATARRIGVLV